MSGPDAAFWQARFEADDTPWDRGGPGPQLLRWIEDGTLSPCRIVVPGCGGGWDAVELARRGFEVTAVDYAEAACRRTTARLRSAGVRAEVRHADVLAWRPEGPVDAVYEQTCLCALHPRHWRGYEESLRAWLRPGGRLFALFMQRPRPAAVEDGLIEGPPYHGDVNAMHALWSPDRWEWSRPPLTRVPHPAGWHELAAVLTRRA